jgi:hypothetical protein
MDTVRNLDMREDSDIVVVDSLEIGNDMAGIMVKMKGDLCIIDNNKSL